MSSPKLGREHVRCVAFESDATNLVPGDTNAVTDIFTYDRTTGVTTRESIGPGGVQANAASSAPTVSFACRFVAFPVATYGARWSGPEASRSTAARTCRRR